MELIYIYAVISAMLAELIALDTIVVACIYMQIHLYAMSTNVGNSGNDVLTVLDKIVSKIAII